MGLIYCLYSTEDRRPRYIGQTTKPLEQRLAQHMGRKVPAATAPVYAWIRTVHQAGFRVGAYAIQPDVGYADLDRFERYWMAQLTGLLNATKGTPVITADTPAGTLLCRALQQTRGPRPNPV